MECNKEEAIKAMDIAKRKVTENDYIGAKYFANKAQNLYPQLDGLKQVLMLINVYISAGNKISGGESDWYGILGVDPMADGEVMKKQYKKLALFLHPDKNKCEGAEGAFKLVSQAWCLLSDKVKRIIYDQKRKSKEVKPKPSRKQKQPPNQPTQQPPGQPKQPPPGQPKQPPPGQPKQPPNQPPGQPKQPPNQPNQPPGQPKQPPNQPKQPPNQPNSGETRNGRAKSNKPTVKVSTFWTMCNKCRTEYEYVRVFYLNKTVLCRNCQGTFMATEKEKTTAEKEKTTTGKEKTTAEKEKTTAEKEKTTAEKEKTTAEKEKTTAEKEKTTAEKEKTTTEKEKTTETEKTPQATNTNTNGASSCGRDCSLNVSVDGDFSSSRMGCFNSGNVTNQAEERAKRVVRESEEASRGIANSDFKVEESVFKKPRIDDYAEASSRIKV